MDEAFLNFEGLPIDTLQQRGQQIACTVKRNTGIPVSIGIAPTKTLAKIASKLCKQYPKLKGSCLMYRPADIEKVVKTYPIGEVWGIGRRYAKMLQGVGVQTAYDFMQRKPEWVQSKMGVTGLRTWKELHGQKCINFDDTLVDKQSICVSRSFAKDLTDFDTLHSSLSTFTAMAAEKLRKQSSCAGQMQVFIYTNRHRSDLPQHYENHLLRFDVATDSTLELVTQMGLALKALYIKGYGYKKAGVILSDIMPKTTVQANLFDVMDRSKHSRLMQTMDSINAHQGRNTITVASQGFDPIKSNQDHISPRFTTQWNEIITVKV